MRCVSLKSPLPSLTEVGEPRLRSSIFLRLQSRGRHRVLEYRAEALQTIYLHHHKPSQKSPLARDLVHSDTELCHPDCEALREPATPWQFVQGNCRRLGHT